MFLAVCLSVCPSVCLSVSVPGRRRRSRESSITGGWGYLVNPKIVWRKNQLRKKTVVTTVMSNLGFEKYLTDKLNIRLIRTKVGDINVVSEMQKNSYVLGGEQSGHIILGKFATTGDGLLVALECLFALRKRKVASELFKVYKSVPQKLVNIKVKNKEIINTPKCKKAIKLANHIIKDQGRLLVRSSGTEPKIRIMCESLNSILLNRCINIVRRSIN